VVKVFPKISSEEVKKKQKRSEEEKENLNN